MENESFQLGQKIKRFRLLRDIRQEDMAEKMGISRATLINYEKGHTKINLDFLNTLKKHYPDFEAKDQNLIKPKIIVDNSIDFKVLWSVLSANWKYILFTSIFFAFLGISSSFLLKKYFSAEISLYPAKNDPAQSIAQFQSLAANLGMNTGNSDQSFNIPDVVKSRLIAGKAVNQYWTNVNGEETSLIKLWNLDSAPWFNVLRKTETDTVIIFENAIKKFNKHIKVSEDRISGLIKISTTFQDPIISADIANFIGRQVELYIQKENSAQSTKEKLFISERLYIVKNELEKSELNLKDFKERNRGYDDSPELFMIFSQLFREVEGKKEVYLTLQQQLELARIDEVKRSPILHVLDYAVPPIKKSSPNRLYFMLVFTLFGLILSSSKAVSRY
tara:strand:+ start:419 stop:1588 length:1170 start_codon:yes stop_codon:yes gene_type:complete